MKSLILLACTLACAYGIDQSLIDQIKVQIQEYGVQCAESEKASPDDIQTLMNRQIPESREGKCVIFCIGKKMNLMSDDGKPITPQSSELLEKLKADDAELFGQIKTIYQQCRGQVGSSDGCDAAVELISCAKAEGEKAGLDKYIY